MSGNDEARAKAKYDFFVEDAHRAGEQASAYGQAAQKALFLANGGSIIALLTFIGNVTANVEERAIFWAFIWFGMGLAAAIFSHFSLFKLLNTNRMYSFHCALRQIGEENEEPLRKFDKLSDRWKFGATWSAGASLVLFLIGSFVALDAVT